MDTYLEDNPPKHRQYRDKRRAQVTGAIVLHTAENSPDTVAPDRGAETVARFISIRGESGSYHSVVDSENTVRIMPYEWEAFHEGTGGNRWSLGLTFATRSAEWQKLPSAWVDNVISNGAAEARAMAAWVKETTGIVVPAQRITAEEYRAHKPGFVTHSDLDPDRRTDPGSQFPWQDFLEQFDRPGNGSSVKSDESSESEDIDPNDEPTSDDGADGSPSEESTGDAETATAIGKTELVEDEPSSVEDDLEGGDGDTPSNESVSDGDDVKADDEALPTEDETPTEEASTADDASPEDEPALTEAPDEGENEETSIDKVEAESTVDTGVTETKRQPMAGVAVNGAAPQLTAPLAPAGAFSFAMDDVDELYRAYKGNRPASVLRRAIARDLASHIFVDEEDPQSFVINLQRKLAAESLAEAEQV